MGAEALLLVPALGLDRGGVAHPAAIAPRRDGRMARPAGVAAARGEAAHDLLLPRPDRAGWTQLDHLARLPDRLLVIETKSLGGRLSGWADERTWTQRFGPCQFSFLNPLWQNALHLEAVRALAGPGVRVEGMVVLVGRGWFDGWAARWLLPAGGLASAAGRAGRRGLRRRAEATAA